MPKNTPGVVDRKNVTYPPKEKAKFEYDILYKTLEYTQARENFYSNKFIEVEMTIASTILSITGAGALLGKFDTAKFPLVENIWAVLIIGWFLLIASLVLGLTAIHVLEQFWMKQMRQTRGTFNVWRQVILQDGNYEQAKADCGAFAQNGIVESAKWPHFLQTISLVVGTIVVLGAASLTLFKKQETPVSPGAIPTVVNNPA